MATVDSKHIVDEIIAGDGYYLDDPRVVKIVQYTTKWGGTAYGLIYKGIRLNYYDASEFIINPVVIFEAK
jgi:hypothetical protein